MPITAAKIKIKVRTGFAPGEADAGYSTIHVVEGIQSSPIVASDYGAHRTKIISGGSLPFTSIDGKQGEFVEIPLNATGISWIIAGGNTKFCLRLRGDIIAAVPGGLNRIWWELDLAGVELIITEDGIETSYYRITDITGHAGVYQVGAWLTAHEAPGTTKHFGATFYDSEGSWWAGTSKWNISRAFVGFDTTGLPPAVIAPEVTTNPATRII